ncbi:MAG: N-6 DNA methylase [Prevotellaceae bacterium]|nr:N-6 DNA methylase [Candidatus Faecinaster equi]
MPVSDSVDKEILSFFKKLENKSTDYINKLIVSSYVDSHKFEVEENCFLSKYVITEDDESLLKLKNIIRNSSNNYGMEELVEVFEFVISPADKEINGAVYTPAYIREFIIREVLSRYTSDEWVNMLYADLSCGCGGFFYSLIKIIKERKSDISISEFIRNNIIGVDIKEYSVERTKILLSIFALQEGETLCDTSFNILCQNSLSNEFKDCPIIRRNNGIDVVIGNPPYVAASKISEENRRYIKKWDVSKTGKSDLYLPFFQLGLENLRQGGTLGYITVNTFYRSLNGSAFRSYMSCNGYDCSVVDFGAEQLFKGCSTYTCICVIDKIPTGLVHYQEATSNRLTNLQKEQFEDIPYVSLDNKKGWILKDKKTAMKIRRIETIGKPLGEVVSIKNGFATLRNDIYLINPISFDDKYFFFEKNGNEFKVEKSICREAIKANLVREEKDIDNLREYIIFPYHLEGSRQNIISEDLFKRDYPYAYEYLISNKEELSKRDKGHKTYPQWFAYGRSQALNIKGERLLFPHICDVPCFVYCGKESMLFYDGYAITAENSTQLEIFRRILSSNIFWYYISRTSKPYSGGFFSLEKRYIRHFGIPTLSSNQKEKLLTLENQEDVNIWLESIYGISV